MNQPIEPELRTGFDTAKVFVCLCVCVRPNFPSLSRTQSGRLWPLSTTKATRAESACMCMSLCIRMSPVYCMSFYMSVCVVGDAATHTQLVCISRRRQDAHHLAQNQSNTSKTTPPSYWQMAIKLKICGHCNNTRTLSRIYKLQTRSNMAVKHNTTGTWETDAHTHTHKLDSSSGWCQDWWVTRETVVVFWSGKHPFGLSLKNCVSLRSNITSWKDPFRSKSMHMITANLCYNTCY